MMRTSSHKEKTVLHLSLLAMIAAAGTHSLNVLAEKLGINNTFFPVFLLKTITS